MFMFCEKISTFEMILNIEACCLRGALSKTFGSVGLEIKTHE